MDLLINLRMAHGVGLAGDTRICILPGRSPDPRVDHVDEFWLRTPPMADGTPVLGVDGIHHIHEYHCREVSAQIRRINSYNTHSWLLCHSPPIGDLGVTSGCFRSLRNISQHRQLAYTRSFIHDRPHWVCLHFYRYVLYPVCADLELCLTR